MAQPGRPLKFKNKAELKRKIDAYFNKCDPHWIVQSNYKNEHDPDGGVILGSNGYPNQVLVKEKVMSKQVPYTITGLAIALKTSRETLLNYEDKEEFSDTIKAAKLRCQQYTENALFGGNSTGPMFSLKNNFSWKDRTEVEHSGEIARDIKEDELDAIIARAEARQSSKTDQA